MNLLTHFDSFATKTPPADAGVKSLRAKAVEFLNARGLPTRKEEEWKYTSVKVLNEETFQPATLEAPQPSHETLKNIRAKLNPAFTHIVFHNGIFNKTMSSVEDLPSGVTFKEQSSAKAGENFEDSFEALNAAYFVRDYLLEVAPETGVPKPIHFIFYTSAEDGVAVMTNPRITLQVGRGSSLTLIESYYGQSEARYFTNSQTQVYLAESAKAVYVRVQGEGLRAVNIGRTSFHLGPASHLHSLAFSTGAALSRHNLVLNLTSPEAFAVVDGVYVVRGSQHVDNTTVIDHQVGACNTSQHYKGILADQSRAVFNGKVAIQRGAQKANSEQLNNNLLLSREAEADSKPQLEIYADDVKAGHGSTVGQMDREELFYLESRGISPHLAIPMMSFGFVSELVYKLENEALQNWLNQELRDAFKGIQVAIK
jgi:Fe-S cluster assembly protein SufD